MITEIIEIKGTIAIWTLFKSFIVIDCFLTVKGIVFLSYCIYLMKTRKHVL